MIPVRLMIVEDEWLNADLIGMLAEDCGAELTGVAHNAAAAEHLAQSAGADLALIDIQLGSGGDGIDLAATLRERFDMKIAFMTGAADAGTMARIERFDPVAVILKPFNAEQLQALLERAAGQAPGGAGSAKPASV